MCLELTGSLLRNCWTCYPCPGLKTPLTSDVGSPNSSWSDSRIAAIVSGGDWPYCSWSALAIWRMVSARKMPHAGASSRPLSCHRPILIVQCCPRSAIQALSIWMALSSRCAAGGTTRGFIAGLTLELSGRRSRPLGRVKRRLPLPSASWAMMVLQHDRQQQRKSPWAL